jgi:hypothetical protein
MARVGFQDGDLSLETTPIENVVVRQQLEIRPASEFKTAVPIPFWTEVAVISYVSQARVGELLDDHSRLVRRVVVNYEQFEVPECLAEHGFDSGAQVGGTLVCRDRYRDRGYTCICQTMASDVGTFDLA